MIQTFADRRTREVFETAVGKRLSGDLGRRARSGSFTAWIWLPNWLIFGFRRAIGWKH